MLTPTATIFLPYHALDDVIQRGTRAAQPDAADVVPGTLYGVTDEGAVVERSNGAAWEAYSPTGGGGGVPSAHHLTHEDGGSDEVLLAQSQVTGLTTALSGKVDTTDPRLSDARTPTLHHLTHEPGGSDALTALDASTLTTGTLPDARLSANVPLLNAANTFTANQTVNGLLTVNAIGTHTFVGAGPGDQLLLVHNTTDGPTGGASLQVTAGTIATQLVSFAAGYTPTGAGYDRAASSVLQAFGAGGLTLQAYDGAGAIRFMTGASAGYAMTLGAVGHLGLGTTPDGLASPAFLTVLSSTAAYGCFIQASAATQVAVRGQHTLNAADGYPASFYNSGAGNGQYLTNTGAWIAISDAHLKTDIRALDVLARLRHVQPRDFLWKTHATSDQPHQRQFGFVAQEVAAVFPELTAPSPEGLLGIAYTGFIAPLVAGWQDHDRRLAALEAAAHKETHAE